MYIYVYIYIHIDFKLQGADKKGVEGKGRVRGGVRGGCKSERICDGATPL